MSEVGIADLKSHLSAHLREVRRGNTVTVLDHGRPVARLIPIEAAAETLIVRPPRQGAPKPGRVALPPPLALPLDGVAGDVVALLLEERRSDR